MRKKLIFIYNKRRYRLSSKCMHSHACICGRVERGGETVLWGILQASLHVQYAVNVTYCHTTFATNTIYSIW